MKKTAINILSLIVLTISLSAISANAQTGGRYTAHIPFDFTVGDRSFSAGDYSVGLVNPAADGGAVMLVNKKNGQAKIVMSTPGRLMSKGEMSRLIFDRYDGQYFLSAILGQDLNAAFSRPKTQKQVAARSINDRENISLEIKK